MAWPKLGLFKFSPSASPSHRFPSPFLLASFSFTLLLILISLPLSSPSSSFLSLFLLLLLLFDCSQCNSSSESHIENSALGSFGGRCLWAFEPFRGKRLRLLQLSASLLLLLSLLLQPHRHTEAVQGRLELTLNYLLRRTEADQTNFKGKLFFARANRNTRNEKK